MKRSRDIVDLESLLSDNDDIVKEKIRDIINSKPTSYALLRIIRYLSTGSSITIFINELDNKNNYQIQLENIHYAHLISNCSNIDKNICLSLFNRLKKEGLTPYLITYNILINGANSLVQALYYFEELIKDGLIPNITTYNSLIRSCKYNYVEAINFYNEIKKNGLRSDGMTNGSLLSVVPISEIKNTIHMMNDPTILSDRVCLNVLLDRYIERKYYKHAALIYSYLRKQINLYQRVIDIRKHSWGLAIMLLDEIISSLKGEITVVTGYVKCRYGEKEESTMMQKMRDYLDKNHHGIHRIWTNGSIKLYIV